MTVPTHATVTGAHWVPASLPHLTAFSPEIAREWEATYDLAVEDGAGETLLRQLDAHGAALDDLARWIMSAPPNCGCTP